jgi:hypothetical protein
MTNYKRTKEYHLAMLNFAHESLGGGATVGDVIAQLIKRFGCAKGTAHRVTHKAAGNNGDTWGGKRTGSGRPAKSSK